MRLRTKKFLARLFLSSVGIGIISILISLFGVKEVLVFVGLAAVSTAFLFLILFAFLILSEEDEDL